MIELLKQPFFLACGTIVFMIANMVGGVILSGLNDEFNLDVLKKSLIKYLAILVLGVMIYVGGFLTQSVILEVLSVDLGITSIISVGIVSMALRYALDSLDKFKQITNTETSVGDEYEQ